MGSVSSRQDPARLLLVDDDPLSRGALRRLVDLMEGITVVGEASNGDEARAGVDELHPDLVLMDVHMGRLTGFEITRELLRGHRDLRVLVVSVLPEIPHAVEALRAGARGFLRKEQATRHLEEAIRTVLRGETYLSPEAALELVQEWVRSSTPSPGRPLLTRREQAVLTLVAQGMSNKEIAAALHSTVRTVKAHVSRILRKLGVEDRTQAAVMALRLGLVPEETSSPYPPDSPRPLTRS